MSTRPQLVILAGPNGSGKSTAAPNLLKGALGVAEYINADVIAQGLSGFEPSKVALAAGRALLERFDHLAAQGIDFSIEVTLASRSLHGRVLRLKQDHGYRVHIIFLRLDSAQLAIERVVQRVRSGGHDVPVETIRRRYASGLRNFFTLYRQQAEQWRFYDGSKPGLPRLIAEGQRDRVSVVMDAGLWKRLESSYHG